jgi:uncharacterized protein YndB with AHSA1/START domain
MPISIGSLVVRRSILIHAPPERVWQEFESLDRMRRWFGTGHTLVAYEPRAGATVETDAGMGPNGEHSDGTLRFVGRVLVYDPPRELTFEQDWVGHGWASPPLVTIRLTPALGGTLVELLHHGFERASGDAAADHRGFEGGWTLRQLEALREIVEA